MGRRFVVRRHTKAFRRRQPARRAARIVRSCSTMAALTQFSNPAVGHVFIEVDGKFKPDLTEEAVTLAAHG